MADKTPQLDPIPAVKQAFNRIQDLKGRSRRSEFWWTMLAFGLVMVFIDRFIAAINVPVVNYFITPFLFLALMPSMVRRLHDAGRGSLPAFIFIGVIFLINILYIFAHFSRYSTANTLADVNKFLSLAAIVVLYILIYFWCEDSQGHNQYGLSEKYPNSEPYQPSYNAPYNGQQYYGQQPYQQPQQQWQQPQQQWQQQPQQPQQPWQQQPQQPQQPWQQQPQQSQQQWQQQPQQQQWQQPQQQSQPQQPGNQQQPPQSGQTSNDQTHFV